MYLCSSYNESSESLNLENPDKTAIQIAKTKNFATANSGSFMGYELSGSHQGNLIFVAHGFREMDASSIGPKGICENLIREYNGEVLLEFLNSVYFQVIAEDGRANVVFILSEFKVRANYCLEGSFFPTERKNRN